MSADGICIFKTIFGLGLAEIKFLFTSSHDIFSGGLCKLKVGKLSGFGSPLRAYYKQDKRPSPQCPLENAEQNNEQ